jgi:hypothetical protein
MQAVTQSVGSSCELVLKLRFVLHQIGSLPNKSTATAQAREPTTAGGGENTARCPYRETASAKWGCAGDGQAALLSASTKKVQYTLDRIFHTALSSLQFPSRRAVITPQQSCQIFVLMPVGIPRLVIR